MAKRKPKYEVLTWDTELQKFTPQVGVRRGPYSLWGLKRALRKLQNMGYPCHRNANGNDHYVLVGRL
jgi:hypothetical protein